MPRFLAPIYVEQEFVTQNETITGNETILGVTSGKESYWSSVSVLSGVSAESFYGDGSNLTGLATKFLPLTGGTLTGGLTGTTALFSNAVYGSTAILGTSSTQLATTAFVKDSIDTGLASGSAVAGVVVARVFNAETAQLTRGMVVYAYGAQGDVMSVKLASASSEATSSKTLGFINGTIDVGGIGFVTLFGSMDKLDLGAPFVEGDALWLGTVPGTYTRVKPTQPDHLVYLGVVERANSGNGTAYVKVQNGYELNEIHDVLITSPASAQILQRNSSNTLWVNQTPLFDDSQISSSSRWNNQLPLSGGTLTGGLTGTTGLFSTSLSAAKLSGSFFGNGSFLTNVSPAGNAGGDLSGIYPNPSVAKLQSYPVSNSAPALGQMLQWSGASWVPGDVPKGGSGGGGIAYYLDFDAVADSPTLGLLTSPLSARRLSRSASINAASHTSNVLSQVNFDFVCGFVTDVGDPGVTQIPAGLWDFNIWLASNSSSSTQTQFKLVVNKYNNNNTYTPIASSDDIYVYDASVVAQYIASVVVPQTTVLSGDRIYIQLFGKAATSNKTLSVYFGDDTPTHVHTTIPSVAGTGLVKIINSVYQSPASLLVDGDVAENADIQQTKIYGLTAALANRLPLSGGALTDGLTATTGTFTTSISSPNIIGTFYGDISNGVNVPHYYVTLRASTSQTGTHNTSVLPNTFTYTAAGSLTLETVTLNVGDIVLFTTQSTTTQNGPWKVVNAGGAGVQVVLERPAFYSGTARNGTMFSVTKGNGSHGFIYVVNAATGGGLTDIPVGTTNLNVTQAYARNNNNAVLFANTFTSTQTLAVGSTTTAPMRFQAGTLLTTPVQHSVEWDGNFMYLTTSGANSARTTNAVFVSTPATSSSYGLPGQIAYDSSFFYVCTAVNTWLKSPITSSGSNVDTTKLPLSGGTLTGTLNGIRGVFTTSLSAPNLSGTHYGDGSNLTGIPVPGSVQMYVLTASSSITKPTSAKTVYVSLLAGGGGGGSGSKGTMDTWGGSGGGGGGIWEGFFNASLLPSSLIFSIGSGGTGGASVGAGVQVWGLPGSNGGDTRFDTYARARGGGGGGGGRIYASGDQGVGGIYEGNDGGGAHTPGDSNRRGGAGGGGGGSRSTPGVYSLDGGKGGDGAAGGVSGGIGGIGSAVPGGDGTVFSSLINISNSSGGGGGGTPEPSVVLGVGGAGGKGSYGCGGGGGGGGIDSSGAGGNGGSGLAIVVIYF